MGNKKGNKANRIEGKVESWSEHLRLTNDLYIFEIGEKQSRVSVRDPVKPKEYGYSLTINIGRFHGANAEEIRDYFIYNIGQLEERTDTGAENNKDYFDY